MNNHSHRTDDFENGPTLRFLVLDGEREVCRVKLPRQAVDNLGDLFPDEDRAQVTAAGVDIEAIKARVRASDYAPQTVVETTAGVRRYRIWIE